MVTPLWWDGLWLNESFATFIGNYATSVLSPFGALSPIVFNTRMKQWAYTSDLRVTTHPIHGKVANTDETFLNFDGYLRLSPSFSSPSPFFPLSLLPSYRSITYGKGASVLKQLVSFLSLPVFQKGMISYFKQHAWSNTALTDFLASLSSVAQEEGIEGVGEEGGMERWADVWLGRTGVNSIDVDWESEEKEGGGEVVMRKVEVSQGNQPLRPHHVEIVVYSQNEGGLGYFSSLCLLSVVSHPFHSHLMILSAHSESFSHARTFPSQYPPTRDDDSRPISLWVNSFSPLVSLTPSPPSLLLR